MFIISLTNLLNMFSISQLNILSVKCKKIMNANFPQCTVIYFDTLFYSTNCPKPQNIQFTI